MDVEYIDGDALREVFPNTGFTRAEREEHLRRTGYMASRLAAHGVTVVASFVSPYRESRDFIRKLCPGFVEIYVSTPLEECERRDVKGLYARARRGEIQELYRDRRPYEPPEHPELTLDTRVLSLEQCVAKVLARLGESTLMAGGMDHLDQLENRSVHILREAYANFKNLGMLWSIGKDSTVLLWLARKAFFGHVPIPLIHIDTSFKIPEMIEYRDRLALEWNLTMIYGQNRQALEEKRTFPDGAVDRIACCKALKTDALKHTLSGEWPRYRLNHTKRVYELDRNTEPFTGVIVGVRADEEGSRSKERYFSPRTTAVAVGRRRSAAGVLEPVQDRVRARHPPADPSAAGLDRAQHLGVHPPRGDPHGLALLRPGRRQALPLARLLSLHPARSSRMPATWTTSSSSCSPGSSPTSPSARAGPRTRKAAAGWRLSGATDTCSPTGPTPTSMLSKKAKYAIKALLALADHEREEPMRIADLAREEQIPPKFLELILLGLKNHGILQSRKGKGGGYLLGPGPVRDLSGPDRPDVRRPAGPGSLRQPDRVRAAAPTAPTRRCAACTSP